MSVSYPSQLIGVINNGEVGPEAKRRAAGPSVNPEQNNNPSPGSTSEASTPRVACNAPSSVLCQVGCIENTSITPTSVPTYVLSTTKSKLFQSDCIADAA